jgi:hypothetical protein
VFSGEEQSELGSALAALSNLQSMHINHAPPGPVTQALSQLTGLTELRLQQQGLALDPGPLVLPSCVKLTLLNYIAIKHLGGIQAPMLQYLDVSLMVECSDLDALRRLSRGVLRVCSSLDILLDNTWSMEDTVALMAVLSHDWQPPAGTLQPLRSTSIGPESSSSCTLPRQWRLRLLNAHCSRQCLELLPEGLGSLHLGWVY